VAYRKLRSSRNGFGSSSRIYLGKDHLLAVESNIFTEKYYRFYFSDIQAFIVRRTGRGTIWSVVLGSIALLMTTCSILSIPPDKWAPTPGYFILALTAMILVIVNLKKGPACVTHVQTSVTVQKIGALNRIERTEQILRELRSCIRKNQGSLSKERILQETVMPVEEVYSEGHPAGEYLVQEYELPGQRSDRYHTMAFMLALASAGMDTMWLLFSGLALYMLAAVSTLAAFCGIIAALVVQTKNNSAAAVRKITWTLFVTHLAGFAAAMVINLYYNFAESLSGKTPYDPFSNLSELLDKGWMDKRGLVYLTVGSIVFLTVLACAGLYYLARGKSTGSDTADGGKQD
jgi:hypothetical protein